MEQVISKFDAAKRQLDCALELFFAEKDAIPIHTLACAAHQVIYDINKNQKGPELLFDHKDTSDSKIMVTKKTLHSHYNFFKHAVTSQKFLCFLLSWVSIIWMEI